MTVTLRELGLFMVLYSGLMTLFMVIVWRINRVEPGPVFWAAAALTGVIVFGTIYVQPLLGQNIIILNNLSSVLGPLLVLEGILRYRRIGGFSKRLPLQVGVLILVAVSATVNIENAPARFALHDPIMIGILLLSAWFLVRGTTGTERNLHMLTAAFFVIFAAALGYRWQAALRGMFEPGQHDNPITGILFLAAMLWALGWAFGLTLSANLRARQRLSILASRDDLTVLPNRRHLRMHLTRRLKQLGAASGSLGVVMMDINGFKPLNDKHGHTFGDQVLQHFARQLAAQLRPEDLAVRYGGDEFVVVLNDIAGPEQMEEACQRLHGALEQEIRIGDWLLDVGVSMGAAVYPVDGTDVDTLLDIADQRMYEHKASRARLSRALPAEERRRG